MIQRGEHQQQPKVLLILKHRFFVPGLFEKLLQEVISVSVELISCPI